MPVMNYFLNDSCWQRWYCALKFWKYKHILTDVVLILPPIYNNNDKTNTKQNQNTKKEENKNKNKTNTKQNKTKQKITQKLIKQTPQ